MQHYFDEEQFTDEEADRIVLFLATGRHEAVVEKLWNDPYLQPHELESAAAAAVKVADNDSPAATETPAAAPDETTAAPEAPKPAAAMVPVATVTAPKVTPETRRARVAVNAARWRASRASGVAKVMGYVAALVLVGGVATGFMRGRIGRNFRQVHILLANLLFASMAIHGSVFLAEYGLRSVFWYYAGIASVAVILANEFGGLLKPLIGKAFVKVHAGAAITGLVLLAIHWVWIYI